METKVVIVDTSLFKLEALDDYRCLKFTKGCGRFESNQLKGGLHPTSATKRHTAIPYCNYNKISQLVNFNYYDFMDIRF